ncbi:phosphonate C-P lyase system protein PhnH [Mesorhizobium retamae]|uniref:Phosphonate C-P lyase system protein PhnH n=1 Tax=Mesorhizobium retamae TaxID=2912854 RepID=A0ABS9QDD8_9HYPH|nr:phosphonate C-P lyase system protein PhnH [Mesorhizobium sp. IRAMC:0171]MCG7505433.1 phosphonate C-P lyase system protein PhnH [Mesorhizobium sp. IRAMC:0171]
MNASVISTQFADPIHDAQQAFRGLLAATSRPGTIVTIPLPIASPAPLSPTLAAIGLTLLDDATPVWLDPILIQEPIRQYLLFNTGARVVTQPDSAAFAFFAKARNLPDFRVFPRGTPSYPDRSATLVVQVPLLAGGRPVSLRGPGIESVVSVEPAGLPDGFWDRWNENAANYPIGIDMILADACSIMSLPRTVKASF